MTDPLRALLDELEQFGASNDATTLERPRRMLNITRDTGEFLVVLVRATRARRVLEIGTSNGYSTLWLAEAVVALDGHVTTLEASEFKLALAAKNFSRSGMSAAITQLRGEAGALLHDMADASFDFIFLDAERTEYPAWWPDIRRILCNGGLLVVDNATSHAGELAPLVAQVSTDPDFTSCTVPVGNGEFLATRASH